MSLAVGSRLLKGHKVLKFCHNIAVSYASSRSLVRSSFTFPRLTLSPKRSPRLVAYCSNASNDSKAEVPDEQVETKILEDEDIQNILRDFAKDFDVDEEGSKILEDIRRTHSMPDSSETEAQNSPTEKKSLEAYRVISKGRFREFEDSDNQVILNYDEEKKAADDDNYFFHIDDEHRQQTPVEVKRGITGVYDIHELVDVLHEENLFDITVISIPRYCYYADYLVLATAKSARHLKISAEHVLKFYKKKKDKSDPFPKIEGERLGSWKALDMGNIVLHVFLEDARACYDIESLWLLDKEFDSGGKGQEDSEELDVLKEQMEFLEALQLEASSTAEQPAQP